MSVKQILFFDHQLLSFSFSVSKNLIVISKIAIGDAASRRTGHGSESVLRCVITLGYTFN